MKRLDILTAQDEEQAADQARAAGAKTLIVVGEQVTERPL